MKRVWRLGTQYELCGCTECHDQCCHEHPWTDFSVFDRLLCKAIGHRLSMPGGTRPIACQRRCGYVAIRQLPKAIVVRL